VTVSSTTNKQSYNGNGSQAVFAYTFKIFADTDIKVYVGTALQSLNTHYTLSGVGDTSGGNVTFTSGNLPASGTANVTILRNLALIQSVDLINYGKFDANVIETAYDKATMVDQQLQEQVDRALQHSSTESEFDAQSQIIKNVADPVNDQDAVTKLWAETEMTEQLVGSNRIAASFNSNAYTGNGSTVAFAMDYAPNNKDNTQVFIDGVYQNKLGYSFLSTTLTFTEAPPLNSNIEIVVARSLNLVEGDAAVMSYTQGGTGSVISTVENKLQESVSVKDFGAVGDGVTDDAIAIQTAIAASYGRRLFFPSGTYIIKSQYGGLVAGEIVAGGDIYWEGETSDTTLKFDPASNTEGMFGFDLAAYKVEVKNIVFDLNNKGSSAIMLQNASPTMSDADISSVLFDNVTVKNARMYTTSVGAYVCYFRGGFRSIHILNSTFQDLTIDSGLTSGHVGGAHIVVEPDPVDPDNRYSQNVSIERCFFSNVKCDDVTYQNDMDGIRIFAPLPSAFSNTELVPSTLVVQDSTFSDCWTRSIKSKVQLNSIEGCTFKLSSAPTGGSGSVHIDFQHNGGVTENCKFYNKNVIKPGCVSATINASIEDSIMGMMCTNNQVYHTGSGSITYPFATYGNAAGIMGAVVKNNTVIADVVALLNFSWSGTTANFVCSDNTVKKLSHSVARISGNGGTVRGNMFSNIHLDTVNTVPIAVDTISGSSAAAIINGSGNIGITEILGSYTGGGNRQQMLRGALLGPATYDDSIGNYAGGVALETAIAANEGTHAFEKRGAQSVSIYMLVAQNWNNNSAVIFSASTSGTVSIFTGTDISLGSTSNPDTAGKLNIWIDAVTGKINIKNRLGSSRYFTLQSLG